MLPQIAGTYEMKIKLKTFNENILAELKTEMNRARKQI